MHTHARTHANPSFGTQGWVCWCYNSPAVRSIRSIRYIHMSVESRYRMNGCIATQRPGQTRTRPAPGSINESAVLLCLFVCLFVCLLAEQFPRRERIGMGFIGWRRKKERKGKEKEGKVLSMIHFYLSVDFFWGYFFFYTSLLAAMPVFPFLPFPLSLPFVEWSFTDPIHTSISTDRI